MARRAVAMGQTEIPVPASPRARAELTEEDKAKLYAEEMGAERAVRQAELAAEAAACTCGVDEKAGKVLPTDKHKPGCHRIPLRFGRR